VKFFSSDPDDFAFLCIAQHARGVIALGQISHGVIAIGQVARGAIAIGQVAVGFFAIGQLPVSATWAAGMVGISGRGFGLVIRVLPKRVRTKKPTQLPPEVPIEALLTRAVNTGHVPVTLVEGEVHLSPDDLAKVGENLSLEGTKLAAQSAFAKGETQGLLGLVAETRPAGGGGYRGESESITRLEAAELITWPPERSYFEAAFSTKRARPFEVVMRFIAWVFLALAIAGAIWIDI
jgi:hypothetical protein